MNKCRFCGEEFSKMGLCGHESHCKENPDRKEQKIIPCKFCKKKIKEYGLGTHEKHCIENPNGKPSKRKIKKDAGINRVKERECGFCKKEYSARGIKYHERYCNKNPNRDKQKPKTKKQIDAIKNGKRSNQYLKAKETGIPYIVTEESKKNYGDIRRGKTHTEESKKKISESMKKAVEENPDSYSANNVCGRIKIEEYNGIKFHGKWEVEVAKWLDENNIKWERDTIEPILYFWNDGWHKYFPDFYLPEHDVLLEVKGFETDRDRAKWNVVENLVVIKKNEIEKIKKKEYKLPR
jgi:hypothetical protein